MASDGKIRVPKLAWLVWGIAFLILEGIALFDGVANDTLTETIHWALPGSVAAFLVALLAFHFWRTYHGKGGR